MNRYDEEDAFTVLRRSPSSLRLGRKLFLLLVCSALLLAGAAPTAVAAEAEADGLPPTVSFVDQQALALDQEEVGQLAKKRALTVRVHNTLGQPQPVTLELIGLDEAKDPGIKTLFTQTRDTLAAVGAGETASLNLSLAQPSPEPAEGAYKATLLAFGRSGGLARRELTITYPAAAGKQEVPGENSLSAERPIDITLRAVNYLPSLLSNLISLGLFLSLLFIASAYLLRDGLVRLGKHLPPSISPQGNGLPIALGAAGALIGLLSLFGALEDGPWDKPSFHAISSRPIDLSPKVPDGTRGTVSSEDGSIAQLIAAKRELRPENLHGANKYTGKYNLGGEAGESEASATVTIRDYWIYAVITITLGLLVGFLLHRWFQEKRPSAKLRARLERLRHNYDAGLSATKDQFQDGTYKDVRIDSRLLDREDQINSLLDAGEAAPATEKLLSLAAYLDRFSTLREKRRNLANAIRELERADLTRLKFDLTDARGYQDARELLEQASDPSGLDSDEAELDARITEVDRLTELIEGISNQVKRSTRNLAIVESFRPAVKEEAAKAQAEIEIALLKAGQQALQADSLEGLAKAKAADDEAVLKLKALARQIEAGSSAHEVRKTILSPTLVTAELFDASSPEAVVAEAAFVESAPSSPEVKARISWLVLGIEGSGTAEVHVDDYVQFSIELEAESQPPFSQVEIDVGEGGPTKYSLPALGTPLIVTHRFRRSKEKPTVVVRSAPGGAVLGQIELPAVDPGPRPLESQRQLAESDKVVGRAAFLLAVGSGMVALYFVDSSWGQPVDYLTAFLWGGATGEGVKLAAALAERVWPAP